MTTGECPTVGIAGGYTQGGGHSALATNFGLSADNTLEFEVVTADGQFLTASPGENPDLYWALSGGGAGNYAVVLSMTVKAHPDAYVGGAKLSFSADGISNATFDQAVHAFHSGASALVAASSMILFSVKLTVSLKVSQIRNDLRKMQVCTQRQILIETVISRSSTSSRSQHTTRHRAKSKQCSPHTSTP